MKNVILYLKLPDSPYKYHDSIIKYLMAQIDNSLHYGWKNEDIVVVTNFEFEYKNIKGIPLKKQCNYNVWANKFYAVKELLEEHFTDDVWLHDYDVWQINNFDFPSFNGMFGGCIYDIEHQNWNGGSFFFTKNSLPLLKYICEYYELNENIISKYYHKNGSQWYTDECIICDLKLIPDISHLFSSLTPEYNLGMTFFKTRYECAKKPIKALHVKLLNKDSKNEFDKISVGLNLIPQHLSEIINNYAH